MKQEVWDHWLQISLLRKMEGNGLNNLSQLNQHVTKLASKTKSLSDLETVIKSVINNFDKDVRIAFVAGPISSKTKLGKRWNRYQLKIRTKRIANLLAKENFIAISASITPYHLEKLPVNNFYAMYDRISDKSHRLYLTGNWRNSKGAVGEYMRAKNRGVPIFELKEGLTFLPIWFRSFLIVQL